MSRVQPPHVGCCAVHPQGPDHAPSPDPSAIAEPASCNESAPNDDVAELLGLATRLANRSHEPWLASPRQAGLHEERPTYLSAQKLTR